MSISDSTALLRALNETLPASQISVEVRVRSTNSQDYAWFSNVLEEDLGGCLADVVVWPADRNELTSTLAAAHHARVPVTVRGGGTGNYGQCVPLRGGLVLNTSRMTKVLEVGDGFARVEAGVRFVDLDLAARPSGQEVRIYPSTYLTATIAGFTCGGSGGIGSVTHGVIADGNVLGASVVGLTSAPEILTVDQQGMAAFVHAYGTTGVLCDVTVPLAPREEWEQVVCSFADIHAAHAFCMQLIDRKSVMIRLMTTVEPAISRHFVRSKLQFDLERTSVLLMIGHSSLDTAKTLILRHRGVIDFVLPAGHKTRLTDFTWNHTTLWAKKSDNTLTYLQIGFDLPRFDEQAHLIRGRFGDDFAMHGEYFRVKGEPFAAALPIIRYHGRQALAEMIDFLESIGVGVANPHRYVLEEGSQVDNLAELLAAKRMLDPDGLLNPGKLGAALQPGEATGHRFKPSSMSLARQRPL